jgi:hypothetical protein
MKKMKQKGNEYVRHRHDTPKSVTKVNLQTRANSVPKPLSDPQNESGAVFTQSRCHPMVYAGDAITVSGWRIDIGN